MKKVKQKKNSYPIFATLSRLLKNIKINQPVILVYFLIYTAAAGVYPFFAVLLPKFLLKELAQGEAAKVSKVLFIVLGYFLLVGSVGFIKTYIHDLAYPKLSALRIDYVRDTSCKVMEMAYPNTEDALFFQKYGKAMEANSTNNNGVEGVYHKLFEVPAILVSILVLAVLITGLSPVILVALVIHVAVLIYVNRAVHRFRYSKKEEEEKWNRKVGYYKNVTNDFTYGKDIRLYRLKDRVLHNYSQEIQGYLSVQKIIAKKEYLFGFVALVTLFLSDIITYFILIQRTADGMGIDSFSMYLTAIVSLSAFLKLVAKEFSFIINEGQYVYEFYSFMDKDMGEKGGNHPAITGDTLEYQFKDVSFQYPGSEKYILRHLNLTIQKGERLAIVGINGAGKSTIVKLMTGLFDVTEGEIRINGIPIQEFDKRALYSMFSVVFQEVKTIAFTAEENVACSSEKINSDRVDEALKKVGLWKKIDSLPKKKQQMMLKMIEEDGAMFSGGESQKLSIARALYKNSAMVIMDEPTAALDALAEAEIYQDFSDLVSGKTAVYISHRLASTKFCDKIALFDQNGLSEYGNHEELMSLQGKYYEMFTIQGKYYREGREVG